MEDKNVIRRKSFDFAVRIVKLCQFVSKNHHETVLTSQLLKSGTSIGANVRESTNAESGADFIHKFGIAQKECNETLYWLELMKATGYLTENELDSIIKDCNELMKIIRSIILTRKANLKKER
ncbi:four helix bundle protein [Salmonirosea aquatica]|uniref:Four helix bundle protein n=1 Tax=Salmonirosea aquatica TaxID=2654236 RepID=A0A7C9BBD6_9BACT|nr:four helix bundle protein [Cytophagaceae bacterium SJW1-29]